MKKNIKIFLCLLAIFIISLGFNVNAEEEAEQWSSEMDIILPIHKTDENGKGLEGAIFTLKDFNGTISYSSSDYKNGDYLIEVYKENEDVLDKNISLLPANYKELITGIKSWEDVQNLTKRDDLFIDNYYEDDYVRISFSIPLKLEESVVPAGYQKEDFVVLGQIMFEFEREDGIPGKREDIEARSEYFDEFLDNGIAIHSSLHVYEMPLYFPGYFKYDSSKDYASLFADLNKKIIASRDDQIYSPEEYEKNMKNIQKIFEDAGYNTKDVKCPSYEPADEMLFREDFGDIQFFIDAERLSPYCYGGGPVDKRGDIEARFDDIVENCYCVIQLKNKKENIVVNPQTASTLGIISLITLGSIGFITTKKLRKNN